MFVLNVLGRGDFVLANRIKNFFDNFVKRNQKSKNNIVEEIDIKEGDKISTFGYSVGDTVEQDYETEALLTNLREQTSSGQKIELIASRDPDVSQAVPLEGGGGARAEGRGRVQ